MGTFDFGQLRMLCTPLRYPRLMQIYITSRLGFAMAELLTVEFAEGPLGISLTDKKIIREVFDEGQGRCLGVCVGDVLLRCGDIDVSSLDYTDVLAIIRAAPRPARLTFSRAVETLSRAPQLTSTTTASAVGQLGGFFKKALSTSVQFVAAIDKAINTAVDDSTKHVVAAARITARETVKQAVRLQVGGVDFRKVVAREDVTTSGTAAAGDLAFAVTHESGALQDLRLGALSEANDAILRRAEVADALFASVRTRVQSETAAYTVLSEIVLHASAPNSIAADLAAISRMSVELKETMTALEGRLTKVSLMRQQKRHLVQRASQLGVAAEYELAREGMLDLAVSRAAGATRGSVLTPSDIGFANPAGVQQERLQDASPLPSATTHAPRSPHYSIFTGRIRDLGNAIDALVGADKTASVTGYDPTLINGSSDKAVAMSSDMQSSGNIRASVSFSDSPTVAVPVAPVLPQSSIVELTHAGVTVAASVGSTSTALRVQESEHTPPALSTSQMPAIQSTSASKHAASTDAGVSSVLETLPAPAPVAHIGPSSKTAMPTPKNAPVAPIEQSPVPAISVSLSGNGSRVASPVVDVVVPSPPSVVAVSHSTPVTVSVLANSPAIVASPVTVDVAPSPPAALVSSMPKSALPNPISAVSAAPTPVPTTSITVTPKASGAGKLKDLLKAKEAAAAAAAAGKSSGTVKPASAAASATAKPVLPTVVALKAADGSGSPAKSAQPSIVANPVGKLESKTSDASTTATPASALPVVPTPKSSDAALASLQPTSHVSSDVDPPTKASAMAAAAAAAAAVVLASKSAAT